MRTSHKFAHTFRSLKGRNGLWFKLGVLTVLIGSLVFLFASQRQASARSKALELARSAHEGFAAHGDVFQEDVDDTLEWLREHPP